ncbi:PLP-dependent aminotransferase family protein [Leptospira gomenensis]|uniref:PLP-dependent aminotransferase family protein n=1 Tax=Leptospira gomenensis TaxID=2484974 RepID=A0A5F1YPK6_9LEPT|nr:PLP-dependent aminotransferase family protein [Leptospira gomenensis]TGK28189.1 PLP-dependent aminotransferase family protein [Leptospira gomenensis]TGK36957.1 PLP-dependent aminotransferase family protein [Leptospira gomenensis]TGK45594.1 PLP-dependent aminotransferase family protein [Leptospira gomenensis]TGK59533.1 PLP-dependent aminotransferase family protein [Leptospira gomenensis]
MSENRNRFSSRILKSNKSFIREILKVTGNPEIISFAGGQPDPDLFPVTELGRCAEYVFSKYGSKLFQYGTSEGFAPLREWIFEKYYKNINYPGWGPENILITSGSQQALDLIGKIFIDSGDSILIERPGYLGAIQAFAMYEPEFVGIPLRDDGLDFDFLERELSRLEPKFLYSNPTFQNPTGKTLAAHKRSFLSEILRKRKVLLIEDNPYGEIRFESEAIPSMISYYPEATVSLGTFSKTLSPGLRLGWIFASKEIVERLVVAKQAGDLHSGTFSQILLHEYLETYDFETQVNRIRNSYFKKMECMEKALIESLSDFADWVSPKGGMFFWIRLKNSLSSKDLFEEAIRNKVAFVPGFPFYTDNPETDTLRLNFSHSSLETIETGISRIGDAVRKISKIHA